MEYNQQQSNNLLNMLRQQSPQDGGKPQEHTDASSPQAFAVSSKLSEAVQRQENALATIEDQMKQLHSTLENTRQAYNRALEERNEMHKMLVSAEGRLGEVQKVVQRYTNVQEPVVASDGYTYERTVIQQYLEECGSSDTKAYSQLTKEVLTDTLLPNQSLKKLVELLKTVKPQEVQEMSDKQPLPPLTQAGRGIDLSNIKFFEDDHQPETQNSQPQETASIQPPKPRREEQRAEREPQQHIPQPRSSEQSNSSQNQNRNASANNGPNHSKKHPCMRVYGHCNFKDDCTFAEYPYDACLNHIKGKCRFAGKCKELHVDPEDARFHNERAVNNNPNQGAPRRNDEDRFRK